MSLLHVCYDKRQFIWESIKREFLSRYTHSLLGGIWAILNPLSMILVYMLIFSQVMRAKLPGIESGFAYSIYLCAGLLPWGLFTELSLRCVNIFVDNGNMLKKVAFPKVCLPAIVLGSALINFGIISILFLVFLLGVGQFPGIAILGCLPLLLLLIALATSIGIFLGTVNVFFRDVGQAYGIICQFWFWFTPLVYPASIVPERFRGLLELNPRVGLMEGFHTIFLEHQWPDFVSLIPITFLTLLFLVGSLRFFRRHSEEIVDEL